jgi:hypothetical protein
MAHQINAEKTADARDVDFHEIHLVCRVCQTTARRFPDHFITGIRVEYTSYRYCKIEGMRSDR